MMAHARLSARRRARYSNSTCRHLSLRVELGWSALRAGLISSDGMVYEPAACSTGLTRDKRPEQNQGPSNPSS